MDTIVEEVSDRFINLINSEIDKKTEHFYRHLNSLEQKLQSLEGELEKYKSAVGELDSLSREAFENFVRTITSVKAKEVARETVERTLEKTNLDERLRMIDGVIAQLREIATDLRERMSDFEETLDEILENIKSIKQTYEKLSKEFKAILADTAAKILKKIDEVTTLNTSMIEDVLPSVVEKAVSAEIVPIEDKVNRIAEEIKKSSEVLNKTTIAVEKRIKKVEMEVERLKQMIEKLKQPAPPRRKYEEEEWI